MSDSQYILADLDEMVFETRDKEYGAYQLRKKYRNYLTIATVICLVCFVLASSAPLIMNLIAGLGDDDSKIDKNVVVTAISLDVPPPPEEEPPPPVEAPPPLLSSIEFKIPEPVPDEEIIEDETIHEMEEIEEETNIGTEDVKGDDKGYDFGDIEGTNVRAIVEEKSEEPDPNQFIMVEKEPQPVNMDEIKKLIGYPAPAKEAEIEGKVVVRILVGSDGKYAKHIVVKNPHNILTKAVEEQLRNISFTPGIQAGKPIKVWVTIPFDFKLLK